MLPPFLGHLEDVVARPRSPTAASARIRFISFISQQSSDSLDVLRRHVPIIVRVKHASIAALRELPSCAVPAPSSQRERLVRVAHHDSQQHGLEAPPAQMELPESIGRGLRGSLVPKPFSPCGILEPRMC